MEIDVLKCWVNIRKSYKIWIYLFLFLVFVKLLKGIILWVKLFYISEKEWINLKS